MSHSIAVDSRLSRFSSVRARDNNGNSLHVFGFLVSYILMGNSADAKARAQVFHAKKKALESELAQVKRQASLEHEHMMMEIRVAKNEAEVAINAERVKLEALAADFADKSTALGDLKEMCWELEEQLHAQHITSVKRLMKLAARRLDPETHANPLGDDSDDDSIERDTRPAIGEMMLQLSAAQERDPMRLSLMGKVRDLERQLAEERERNAELSDEIFLHFSPH